MMLKATLAGIATLLAAPALLADHERYDEGYDSAYAGTGKVYARVLEVQPIVRYVTVTTPRRECWREEVHYREPYVNHRRHAPAYNEPGVSGAMIAGGLIGGVIGRQFGSGSGRDAMTLVGTLVGSSIAHDRASARRGSAHATRYRQSRHTVEQVRRCRVHDEQRREQRIDGYRVTYLYQGREYETRMPYDPGDRIPVTVTVTPVDG